MFDLKGLEQAYGAGPESADTNVLAQLIHDLVRLMQKGQLDLLDKLLPTIDFGRISPEAAISIFRTLFPVHSGLTNWEKAVNNARGHYQSCGLDVDRVFAGL